MSIKSLTNRNFSEGRTNLASSKWAEDTESKLLEDIWEVCLSVNTAPANTAQIGWAPLLSGSVLFTYTLASLQDLLKIPKSQAASLTT